MDGNFKFTLPPYVAGSDQWLACTQRGKSYYTMYLTTKPKDNPMISHIFYCDMCGKRHESTPEIPSPTAGTFRDNATGQDYNICRKCRKALFSRWGIHRQVHRDNPFGGNYRNPYQDN